jgi:hypothetical protein
MNDKLQLYSAAQRNKTSFTKTSTCDMMPTELHLEAFPQFRVETGSVCKGTRP